MRQIEKHSKIAVGLRQGAPAEPTANQGAIDPFGGVDF
jgi:hypothetical protein